LTFLLNGESDKGKALLEELISNDNENEGDSGDSDPPAKKMKTPPKDSFFSKIFEQNEDLNSKERLVSEI
jgi:hypothetical protein